MEELKLALNFLSDCVDKKSKFPSSAKEASWGKFHAAVVKNANHLNEITESPQFSTWLCLKLFMHILGSAFQASSQQPHFSKAEYTPEEDDIVIYIGGSVVSKLKRAAYRLSDSEKVSQLDALGHLIDESASKSSDSLTDVLDRGGLIRLVPQIQAMFVEMECIFRQLFSSVNDVQLSAEKFRDECTNNDLILCGYYETTYASVANETTKLQIFNNVISLYFRIRAYHKCRTFMNQYRHKIKVSQKVNEKLIDC